MFDIACVGILTADCIVKPVEKLPDPGKLELIDSLKLYTGGCALNAAIDLAKLGANVAIIGMVGNDGFGKFMKGETVKYGVNADGLKESDEFGSSASVVIVRPSGERSFIHTTGANAKFSESDVDYSIIEKSDIVFVAGTMLMPTFDGEECATMLKKCHEMGKTTVLDVAWDDTGRWMDVLAPCMPHIDYFIPSVDEAEQLAGTSDVDKMADCFFDMGVGHVAIKVGKDGCYVRETKDSEGVILPTYDKFKPVDTTGAGDSFCSGFLYGLSHGMSMIDSAKLGNAVGTHCIMEVGASTGIKSYAEIKKFMEENEI